ncbi:lytic murein transglycosylase [Pseudooceanicola antarcticus]|uniref:Lytic murein transglycosylase n=1 Tax=Pseudooceanicola antarcticus TaxID=1247613 RepID=A0A285HMI6_9RHOB|nr:lytic murein transglycosylase [Pseudooceanicola antarcticus]PJE27800.1 lytic murein transglycosylase [Pseudooceanicola antarcticus]SNY36942.1 lytic murein transglycosylase [Pseudooceanicola antarcticus]
MRAFSKAAALFLLACALPGAGLAQAGAPQTSLRPLARPVPEGVPATRAIPVSRNAAVVVPGVTLAVSSSLRPQLRPRDLGTASTSAPQAQPVASNPGFEAWKRGFRGRAMAQGITAATFDRAFRGARFMPDVIKKDRNQSEFTKSIQDYMEGAVSDSRVRNGRRAYGQQSRLFSRIERSYGVPGRYIAAIWGLETAYGSYRGKTPLISSMATLAYEGRRGRFYEAQLIALLKVVQHGDSTPENMQGSWAGASGHTQFMPTSYLSYAVDFTGDGRRDIWAEDPSDSLASSANYLSRHGWKAGQPWGLEVVLPQGFDYSLSNGPEKMPSAWARLGVRPARGELRDYGQARLLLLAGAKGPAFLVFDNFDVIKRYNNADTYALAVGILGDRIAGAGDITRPWPAGERMLKRDERIELQQRLQARGYDTGGIDGILGSRSIAAIRAYQRRAGMLPDGHPSVALLTRLRR